MRTTLVMETLHRLTAERGEKRDGFYYATFSCKDVLDYMDAELTQGNLRHVAYIVTKGYPESVVDKSDKQLGWILNMRIRSK